MIPVTLLALLIGAGPPDPTLVTSAPPSERKRILARRTDRAPVRDGALDEALWKQAPAVGGFLDLKSGEPAPTPGEVRVRWDARNLYLAVTGGGRAARPGPALTVLVHGATVDSGTVALEVTAAGAVRATYRPDRSAGRPRPFRCRVRAATRLHGSDGRSTEIAIPMGDLRRLGSARSPVPPAPGNVWGLNVVSGDSAWSRPAAGDLYRLDQFGELVFVDEDGEDPLTDEGREAAERGLEEKSDEPAPPRRRP